jgi:hypothetical protein
VKKLILYSFLSIVFCNSICSQSCTPQGNETSYGSNNTWIGYVYDNLNFTNYKGYVNEGTTGNPNFDESFGGDNVMYATNGCPVQTETFSVRYKLTKTFTNASYDFTVGGDDGFRLSLDGGTTWVINRWNDQSYTTTTYTATLNGSYNMVLEYYENGGGNRISFSVVTGCSGSENTATYGASDVWKGYVYTGMNFNSYKGMVTQGSAGHISFDQDFGGSNVQYATSGCGVQTENFSVRYRLTKTFAGNYSFVVGGDDGYRLSFDGGSTWAINHWNDQSYNTTTYTTNLNGSYNMVLEYYENSGENRISLFMQPNSVLKLSLLSFSGRKDANNVVLDWNLSADSDPFSFDIERSPDGRTFDRIQTIPGTSGIITSNNRQYSYDDATPLTGNSFYRLKMTDQKGKISYSYIVFIHESITKPGELTLFPTIITDNIIYCKTGRAISKAMINLRDISGRLIYQQLIGKIEKGQTIGISLGAYHFSKGIYLLSIIDNNEQLITQRVIF